MLTADEIKSLLNLKPLPEEGGYFVETYRSEESIPKSGLPARYASARVTGTAIYYLLTPETFSAMHRLPTDEIFHFYVGDPVEMLQLGPDGGGRMVITGNDLGKGMLPQVVVPKHTWQGSRLVPGGRLALMGTTMAPGFEFADYEAGTRDKLIAAFPAFQKQIVGLTRS